MQPSQSLITFGGVNVKDLTLQELWTLASVEPEEGRELSPAQAFSKAKRSHFTWYLQ